MTGVARQFDAFKEGFNSVFPLSSLQLFYSHEVGIAHTSAYTSTIMYTYLGTFVFELFS